MLWIVNVEDIGIFLISRINGDHITLVGLTKYEESKWKMRRRRRRKREGGGGEEEEEEEKKEEEKE